MPAARDNAGTKTHEIKTHEIKYGGPGFGWFVVADWLSPRGWVVVSGPYTSKAQAQAEATRRNSA